MSALTVAIVRADCCGAYDCTPGDFDSMVRELTARAYEAGNKGITELECAERLRRWAIDENTGNGLSTAGFDLDSPKDIARALASYSRPRVWAALCGHTRRHPIERSCAECGAPGPGEARSNFRLCEPCHRRHNV